MQQILKTLKIWCEPEKTYELRCPKTGKKKTISGYFDDIEELAREAEVLSDDTDIPSVYLTLNPVNSDLLARSVNHTKPYAENTTNDSDIVRRRWLLVDCDVKRPSGISSSDEEHEKGLAKCRQIRDCLTDFGFPQPIFADSGNGGHLLYRIDLPNTAESTALIQRFLKALGVKFDDEAVKIDQSVFNASRISKLYGTMVRKGDNHPSRPWRQSSILDAPEDFQEVPEALLADWTDENLEEPFPGLEEGYTGPHDQKSVEDLMNKKGVKIESGPKPYKGGLKWTLEECVNADNHSDNRGDVAVFLKNGCVGYRCLHSHCTGLDATKIFGESINKHPEKSTFNVKADEIGCEYESAKSDKSSARKFEKLADAFLTFHRKNGNNALFTSGRMYFYDKSRYVECEELNQLVREYFRLNGLSQSNNVIGNVVPIVQNAYWKDATKVGQMPFWDGNDCPFDKQNTIAFSNLLLDITNWRGRPHTPQWCSTFCLPFDFDSKATCPRWLQFLNEVFEGDESRIKLIQEWFGYCMTSDTSLQKALVLIGKSRSGKGIMQRVLAGLIGKDNTTGFSLVSLSTEFGAASLVNKSVALVGEVELSANPNRTRIVEVLKSIIGTDPVDINCKYENSRTVRLGTRFCIAANTIPRLYDASGALGYRFLFCPFEVSFLGREDSRLEEKLLKELPGIAVWALAGLKRLREQQRFTVGESHHRVFDEYTQDTSPILAWLRSQMLVHRAIDPGDLPADCLTSEKQFVGRQDAHDAFCSWCDENDLPQKSIQWFGSELKTILPKLNPNPSDKEKFPDGSRRRVYYGIGLRQPVSRDQISFCQY